MRKGIAHAQHTVTQHDVAARCGLSRTTVSLSLSNDPQIPPATRERVRAAAAELGYSTAMNQAAARLNLRKYDRHYINHAIAVFMPAAYFRAHYFSALLEGIQEVLDADGFAMVVASAPLGQQFVLPPMFSSGEIDAVLCCFAATAETLFAQLRQLPHIQQCPFVSLIRPTANGSSVTTDDRQGPYLAARHLLELGHRHFLQTYAAGGKEIAAARIAGVEAAVREWGLDPQRHIHARDWYLGNQAMPRHLQIYDYPGPDCPEIGFFAHIYQNCLDFFRTHPEITAVFAQNDPYARRLAYLLQGAGMRIPEDISLVGFDDTDGLLNAAGVNILTTIAVPLVEIGRRAARLAIRQVVEHRNKPEQIVLPAALAIRGTTGPARG